MFGKFEYIPIKLVKLMNNLLLKKKGKKEKEKENLGAF